MIQQRNTVQRQIVLDVLKRLGTHPSIDVIYDEINKSHPSISKSTVYRNLRQLAKSGLARQVMLPDKLERYDGNADPHYHFICKICEKIYDLEMEYLSDINNSVEMKHGFKVDGHDMVFSGICKECARE